MWKQKTSPDIFIINNISLMFIWNLGCTDTGFILLINKKKD